MDSQIISILVTFGIAFLGIFAAVLIACFSLATICVALYALGTWTVKSFVKAYDPIIATTSQ